MDRRRGGMGNSSQMWFMSGIEVVVVVVGSARGCLPGWRVVVVWIVCFNSGHLRQSICCFRRAGRELDIGPARQF